ncbi:MAG: GHKL domain-containing protein [Oscillospiraceae bacterium]|nr:GHKL domain-containing protein [Oscillospiraceae bacterium]
MEYKTSMDILIYCTFNILVSLLQSGFMWYNLTPKYNKYLTLFLSAVPFSLLSLAPEFMTFLPEPVPLLIAMAYSIASAIFLFKDKLRTRIFIWFATYVIILLVETLFIYSAVFFGIDSGSPESIYPASPYIISFSSALLTLFTFLRKRRFMDVKSRKNETILFISILIAQFSLVQILLINHFNLNFGDSRLLSSIFGNYDNLVSISLFTSAIFNSIADIALFITMAHSSQNERLREELKMQEYQNSVNLEYYKNVEKNSVEARKIRHDLANMVQTAYEIMENGTDSDKESAKKMFAQLKAEVSDIKIERFCQNTLVNAIASNKAAECRKNEIDFDFDLRVPEDLGIEEVDICKAYVNIFDNAINAAKAIDGKRYVKIKSFTDESDGMLYITGENNVAPDYEDKKKSRTGEHGYGLRILRDTAEKYGGRLVTDDKGNTFTVVMTMKAESQPA